MAHHILVLMRKNPINPHSYVYSCAGCLIVGWSFHLNPNVVYESMEGTDKSRVSPHCRLAPVIKTFFLSMCHIIYL